MIKYSTGNSTLHKAKAKTKIRAFFTLTLAAAILPFEYAALLLPFALFLHAISKTPLERTAWKAVAALALFAFAMQIVFRPQNGVYYGILNAAYVSGVLLLAGLLLITTKPGDLRDALMQMGLPKKHAFMLTIALEAVPLLQAKAEKVRMAQNARGSERKLMPMLVPLLHSLFERAKKLSISLEARGFSPEKL